MFNLSKYLPNDEEVVDIIHSVKVILYLKLLVILLFFLVPFFFMIPILNLGIKGISLSLLILTTATYFAFRSYRKWFYNCIILSKRKIYRFYQEGLFQKKIREFYLDNIDEIDIEYRGFISKVFKVGDLVIYLKNNKYVDLDDVADIKKIKNKIWELAN